MTQEDKQLLLSDLCPRLPYGVYVRINEIHCLDKNEAITEGFIGGYCKPNMCQDYSLDEIYEFLDEEDGVKLYLRPMSSMTEEEKEEYNGLLFRICDFTQDASSPTPVIELTTFFYSHHFDCCGLIEKGLALEAPKDMYRYEND